MKKTTLTVTTAVFNLILAIGATTTGIMMLRGAEVFGTFPEEWLTKLPISSWTTIGMLAILVFGLGNLTAFVLSIRHSNLWTIIMSGLLIILLVAQILLLGEVYLATVEFTVVGLVQLALGIFSRRMNGKPA